MSDFAAVFFFVLRDEGLAYKALQLFLLDRKKQFLPSLISLEVQRKNVGHLVSKYLPRLYRLIMEDPMTEDFLFLHEWLLLSFFRQFSFVEILKRSPINQDSELLVYWDHLFSQNLTTSENFEAFVCLAILKLYFIREHHVLRHIYDQDVGYLYKSLFHAPETFSIQSILKTTVQLIRIDLLL